MLVVEQAQKHKTSGRLSRKPFFFGLGAVAERLRHRSREQRVPSSSPAWPSVLR